MIDYFTSNIWLLWVIVCVIFLIAEVSTGTIYVLCFAVGALFGMIASLIGVPFWVQIVVFAIFTVASVYWVRPVLFERLHRKADVRLSNVEAMVGREGKVIDTIEAGESGYVKIDGDEWKAVTPDGSEIEVGTKVRVVSMESIVITVERI